MKRKKLFFFIWIVFLIFIISFYITHRSFFEKENLKNIFSQNLYLSFFIYFILGTLRGFTLFPSMPFVFAGALVLPALPFFLVNIVCILTSSSIVYYWGEYLGFDKYFNKNYPNLVIKLKTVLRKRELPIITFWGFFPFIPTDMICYICEIVNIKLWKCLLGVTIGEGIIYFICIFGSEKLANFIF